MSIEVRQISKSFGTFHALRNVDLTVNTGEVVALLGPSGSGKTTLLRIIAGLEEPDEGSGPILFDEENVAHRGVGRNRRGRTRRPKATFSPSAWATGRWASCSNIMPYSAT
jgi:sulfate transport system ATP-binding protein